MILRWLRRKCSFSFNPAGLPRRALLSRSPLSPPPVCLQLTVIQRSPACCPYSMSVKWQRLYLKHKVTDTSLRLSARTAGKHQTCAPVFFHAASTTNSSVNFLTCATRTGTILRQSAPDYPSVPRPLRRGAFYFAMHVWFLFCLCVTNAPFVYERQKGERRLSPSHTPGWPLFWLPSSCLRNNNSAISRKGAVRLLQDNMLQMQQTVTTRLLLG